MKRASFGLLFALLLTLVGLGVAEALVRAWNPPPRRLMVRLDRIHEVREVDGVTLWSHRMPREPDRRAILEGTCEEDSFRVVVIGDSIFHGQGGPAEQVASVRLQEALRAGVPVCVRNFAVSGFSMYQSVVAAKPGLQESPDVVLLELWGGPPRVPTRFDDTVYYFEEMPIDALGLGNPVGIPPRLNQWLFRYSRLYEYAVLASPEPNHQQRFELGPHLPLLDGLREQVTGGGGVLVTWMPAMLNAPFDAQPEPLLKDNEGYEAWVAEHGITNVRLWEAFAEHSSAELALDHCHMNARGHVLLTDAFVEQVGPLFDRWVQQHR